MPKFFKPDGPGFGFKSYSRSSNLSGALMNIYEFYSSESDSIVAFFKSSYSFYYSKN